MNQTQPDSLAIATAGALFQTSNNGVNWKKLICVPVGNELTQSPTNPKMFILISTSTSGGVNPIYSSYVYELGSGAVSRDKDATIIGNPGQPMIDYFEPQKVYIPTNTVNSPNSPAPSVYVSNSLSQKSWSLGKFPHAISPVSSISPSPVTAGTVFAGTTAQTHFGGQSGGSGVFVSANYGKTWTPATGDLPGSSAASAAYTPFNGGATYIGTLGGGIYYQTGASGGWSSIPPGGRTGYFVSSLSAGPSTGVLYGVSELGAFSVNPGNLKVKALSVGFVPSQFFADDDRDGVIYAIGSTGCGKQTYKSTDQGKTWTPLGLLNGAIVTGGSLAVSKSNPMILYSTPASQSGASGCIANSSGLFRSNDGGQNWSIISSSIGPVAQGTVAPYALYGWDGNNIQVSLDQGDSWTQAAQMSNYEYICGGPGQFAVGGNGGNIFYGLFQCEVAYTISYYELYMTSDYGKSWSIIGNTGDPHLGVNNFGGGVTGLFSAGNNMIITDTDLGAFIGQ